MRVNKNIETYLRNTIIVYNTWAPLEKIPSQAKVTISFKSNLLFNTQDQSFPVVHFLQNQIFEIFLIMLDVSEEIGPHL